MSLSPEHGVSREIVWLSEAFVVPPRRRSYRQKAGVLTAHGEPVPHGDNWVKDGPLTIAPNHPGKVEQLKGTHVFGGVLKNHFGHAITEGISRFWAFGDIQPDAISSILFAAHDPNEPDAIVPLIRNMLSMVGINLPIGIVTQPVQVERLCVPGQGFGLGPVANGTPEHQKFFSNRFARSIPAGQTQKLYLSRSALDPLAGGAHNESRLEAVLQANGYQVYHPQEHTLEQQVSTLKGASHIVALDGSALHLAALVRHPGQKIAIVSRNPVRTGPAKVMAEQLSAMDPQKDVILCDALIAFHRRADARRGDRSGLATLDIPKLTQTLIEHSFLPEAAEHSNPPAEDLAKTRDFIALQSHEFKEWLAHG